MNKKTLWGIIALAVVLLIIGIVVVMEGEEDVPVQQQEEFSYVEHEELIWQAEDELFYAGDLIYGLEGTLDDEFMMELYSDFERLERRFFNLEADYYEGEMDYEEFQEEMSDLIDSLRDFVEELRELN